MFLKIKFHILKKEKCKDIKFHDYKFIGARYLDIKSTVKFVIKNYLGDDVKLIFEVNKLSLNPEVEIISEKWHYDIVGERIKIFAFLNDCQKVFTEYVAGTNNIKHKIIQQFYQEDLTNI